MLGGSGLQRPEAGTSIYAWHDEATAAAASNLFRRLSIDGFRYRRFAGDEAYSLLCCARGTSEAAVQMCLPTLRGTLLVALLEECAVPAAIAELSMFRVDLPQGYSQLIRVMRGEVSHSFLPD